MTPEKQRENAAKWKRASRQYSRGQARQFRDEVIGRCRGMCEICEDFQPWTLELHHIVPVKNGGYGDSRNLIALCPTCHAVLETLHSRSGRDARFHTWMRRKYGDDGYAKFEKLYRRERP